MKITLLTFLCTLALALGVSGQTPSPAAPPDLTAAPSATTAAPAAPTAPVAAPTTPAPTASPASTLSVTVSTTPSADDAIDNMIEKKIRSHFNFTTHDGPHFKDEDSAWIALPIVFIVFLAIFGMPVLIVAVILYFSFSKNRAMHKTVRLMVEKGQPVPEALLNPPPIVRQRSDLRRGIKWMLVGIGVMIFFGACNDWEGGAWSIGIIPFLIGAGYLIFWRLDISKEPVVREDSSPKV